MRSIKFRGKSTMSIEELNEQHFEHEDGWFYGNLVMYGNTPYIVGDFVEVDREYTVNDFWMPVHPKSLGQFTGLTDKNGKEIYEKDILDFDNRRHVVTFDNGGFGIWKDVRVDLYSNQMRQLREPLWNLVVDGCEVIGNIYEDKHLLEESK